jgi:hypothetical protein
MSRPRNPNITNWDGVNSEIDFIHRRLSQLQGVTGTKSAFTIISGGGSSSSLPKQSYRSGLKLLAVGNNFIPFVPDIGTSNYNLLLWAYGTDGVDVGIGIGDVAKNSTGFNIKVSQILILEWVAIPT